MELMPVSEVIEIAKPSNGFTLYDTPVRGVSIDTRTLKPGDLFIAVKGQSTDGHLFVQDAVQKGASGIVVQTPFDTEQINIGDRHSNIYVVRDSLEFLGNLARLYLKKLGCRVICVTGTNGKTSVKDFIVKILSEDYFTTGTKGNFNNLYGLPLSIFEANCWTEVAVFEMGMSAMGEIARLCEIAQPEIGVLNNISAAHLEGLGNLENVIRAKAEMLKFLSEKNKPAVINIDDENVVSLSRSIKCPYVTVGTAPGADFRITDIAINDIGNARFEINGFRVELNIPGFHNVSNSAIALAAAVAYGTDFKRALTLLPALRLPEMRCTVYKIGGISIINDAYNANPQSVREAIKLLGSLKANRRFMVLGDMLELGDQSEFYHRKIGNEIGRSEINHLITFGEMAKLSGEEAAKSGSAIVTSHFQYHHDIAYLLNSEARPGDLVLFKGSRGMKLETALELFESKIRKI
ncbi:MAG: hypothetical protein CO189_10320 [candidate division Zixibacteria bacterium CG_4_9_14_3_um_filter_46_8]|nr:MAG: hypothetical protein CO189_10320 [candidate division Zixibacteria bacterium CG_4_9_14_3_um_filter_46_8]